MRGSEPAPATRASGSPAAGEVLQRKCEACEDDEKVQRKASLSPGAGSVTRGATGSSPASEAVTAQVASTRGGGEPLGGGIRSFMERRLGADRAGVRIHTGAYATQMSQDLSAQAFTVGDDIYFNSGRFAPESADGKRLLAHELAHTMQQGGSPMVQRACLPAAACATPSATLTNFVAETEAKPENVSKADRRKKACTKVPRARACTADGHGAPATALTKLLMKHYPARLAFITGIFVHKDMPATWGAVTSDCSDFMPPLPGGKCTFVPDRLEIQARQFDAGAGTVGGMSRTGWLTSTLGTLTHETEHARFDTSAPIAEPTPTACKFADHESNLSELAAHLSEMHVHYRAALTRPAKDRFAAFFRKFSFWVKNGSEDISGIVKDLRCKCECVDADYYIRKTVESVSSNQNWDTNEALMIHTELRDPKWGLDWPVAPPASVSVADLPTVNPVPLKLQ